MEKAISRFKETPQGKDVDFEVLSRDCVQWIQAACDSYDSLPCRRHKALLRISCRWGVSPCANLYYCRVGLCTGV